MAGIAETTPRVAGPYLATQAIDVLVYTQAPPPLCHHRGFSRQVVKRLTAQWMAMSPSPPLLSVSQSVCLALCGRQTSGSSCSGLPWLSFKNSASQDNLAVIRDFGSHLKTSLDPYLMKDRCTEGAPPPPHGDGDRNAVTTAEALHTRANWAFVVC